MPTFANCSNLATASWNSVVVWKYCVFVDEHVLDANLWLSANRGRPLSFVFKLYVFDPCSRSAVATCSLLGPSARPSHSFTFYSVTPCD